MHLTRNVRKVVCGMGMGMGNRGSHSTQESAFVQRSGICGIHFGIYLRPNLNMHVNPCMENVGPCGMDVNERNGGALSVPEESWRRACGHF